MVIHSRILIDPRPKERQPFKTRGEVKRQMSKIMDLIKKGDLEKTEYEMRIFNRRLDETLKRIRIERP